ncbi:helix-turn-helix domain-containing protein [Micromonospora sp. DR5-3]|uniref:helix-turn-helix domain-containing protein n=1 Tax=unclassified Micromonospora TaxID=2617518 RepID=UPI0011D7EE6E|nr:MULTISPECIES: helix-turn-helix transcriptional regulator [unclassified Micromonospora]MCW3820324.1 helix-turn-helix domain-containing protein [Micromonospora sp. DR5-3]TYC19602.1 helix-turn-helix domain-containing protein [Micromonospora sp. MP36]
MTTVPAGGDPASGPTVLRMLLGAQLRRLREGAGVSRESAGWEIRSSESKISRMELGRVGFKERDVADLLTLYGVTAADEREALLKLARDANSPGWWHRYGDVLPSWFQSYLGLEAAAVLIRTYEVQFVPGLLQTPEYARAVILLGHRGAPAEELDRRVSLRTKRQEVLRRDKPPQLWAVLDEAALRRPIGGPEVMRGQLDALIAATAEPHVQLQIVPFAAGGHAAASGAFSILRFGDQDLPDVVYIEQLTSAIYLDKRDDLDYYALAMERLCVEAAPPERTRELLAEIRDELYPA